LKQIAGTRKNLAIFTISYIIRRAFSIDTISFMFLYLQIYLVFTCAGSVTVFLLVLRDQYTYPRFDGLIPPDDKTRFRSDIWSIANYQHE